MKNTKEVKAILTAIFAINRTGEHEDKDISLILDYAFRRLFGANTNLLILSCIGKTKEQIMSEVMQVLKLTRNTKIFGGIPKMTPFRRRHTSIPWTEQ